MERELDVRISAQYNHVIGNDFGGKIRDSSVNDDAINLVKYG